MRILDKIKIYLEQQSRLLRLPAYSNLKLQLPGNREYLVQFDTQHKSARVIRGLAPSE